MSDEFPQSHLMINTNTYVSIGLIMLIVGGIWAILSAISSIKSDISSARVESNARFDKVETRVSSIETSKNVWTSTDMFKWAVHLQQANSDPKKLQSEGLKVPEPEVNTK